jgi:hypothetical protein
MLIKNTPMYFTSIGLIKKEPVGEFIASKKVAGRSRPTSVKSRLSTRQLPVHTQSWWLCKESTFDRAPLNMSNYLPLAEELGSISSTCLKPV